MRRKEEERRKGGKEGDREGEEIRPQEQISQTISILLLTNQAAIIHYCNCRIVNAVATPFEFKPPTIMHGHFEDTDSQFV